MKKDKDKISSHLSQREAILQLNLFLVFLSYFSLTICFSDHSFIIVYIIFPIPSSLHATYFIFLPVSIDQIEVNSIQFVTMHISSNVFHKPLSSVHPQSILHLFTHMFCCQLVNFLISFD